jgi:hypothetical protein
LDEIEEEVVERDRELVVLAIDRYSEVSLAEGL